MSRFLKQYSFLPEGLVNSYGQIFFSNDCYFSILLILASFFDPFVGISGILAIIFTQATALFFGYSHTYIKDGSYSYNSLMVGFVVGIYYQFNFSAILMLLFFSILTFFITIWLQNKLAKSALPFLSLPFLFGVWLLLLSAQGFHEIKLNARSAYTFKETWSFFNEGFAEILIKLDQIQLPKVVNVYFRSMGAVLFQYHLFAGILMTIGLIYYSRIAFLLSVIGFSVGYGFYQLLSGNMDEIMYTYIGFNFILTAIALGGFFIIPSKKSYLLVVLTVPIIALLISALATLFHVVHLPIYSLPFNIIVLLVLLVLKYRVQTHNLDLVSVQHFQPESNRYKFINAKERFKANTYFHIMLPFFGEWRVSQAYDDEITHKGEWKEALDFDIVDEENKTFTLPGKDVEHYLCYDLPVLAPAGGYIVEIIDEVEDNLIGDVDLHNNWGNTIIIKHSNLLYSKLSHLKQGSIKVKIGDYVHKGDQIAKTGSSGRSPEPHLHFQLQATPYVGSKTLAHPIAYYLTHENGKEQLHQFEVPKKHEILSSVASSSLLKSAFKLTPGQELRFEVKHENGEKTTVEWEVFVDVYGNPYIYCKNSGSLAYFNTDDSMFYFTDFKGKKSSFLYQFYIVSQRILLANHKNIQINDQILPHAFFNSFISGIQDFSTVFFDFLKAKFSSEITYIDDPQFPKTIQIETKTELQILSKTNSFAKARIIVKNEQIHALEIHWKNKKITAKCLD